MKRFSAGVVPWPLARRNSQLPLPLQHIACFCQFVLVAACRFLQCVTYFVGRSARALSPLCFRCFRFVDCAGVEAGPW